MQSMETIVNYFAKDMRSHGIPVRKIRKVRVNNSVNYYGCCKLFRSDNTIADITISNMTVACGKESLKNTIIHELCHASLPIEENHGKQFQELAKRVSKIYHTDIKQYGETTKEAEEFEQSQYKYKVTCKQCGSTWHYIRKTKFVKYPHLYQCGCGGNDFTVEVLK